MLRFTLPTFRSRAALGGAAAVALLGTLLPGQAARAQTLAAPFTGSYTLVNLGTPQSVPGPLGGINFQRNDPTNNTLLLGGAANTLNGDLFNVPLTRTLINGQNRITGFGGPGSFFANANGTSGGIDGGLVYAPNGVLLYTSYQDNLLGQIRPGSTGPDKLINLTPLGIASSVGTLQFIPSGFGANSGRLLIASYNTSNFYTADLVADGAGTFDLANVALVGNIPGGPEGIIYVPAGSPGFANPSVLISEYSSNRVSAYDVNASGIPLVGTRRDFITGLSGAEGAVLDPVSNDFLFSTFGGGNQVVAVRGFAAPTQVTAPEPGSLALFGFAFVPILARRVRRRRRAQA